VCHLAALQTMGRLLTAKEKKKKTAGASRTGEAHRDQQASNQNPQVRKDPWLTVNWKNLGTEARSTYELLLK